MFNSDDFFAKLFELGLAREQERIKTATGSSRDDFMYDQAESARTAWTGYAYVTYKGQEYGPEAITWGPLDGDKEKSTVLIQTKDGKWVKLWFLDKDLQPSEQPDQSPKKEGPK